MKNKKNDLQNCVFCIGNSALNAIDLQCNMYKE